MTFLRCGVMQACLLVLLGTPYILAADPIAVTATIDLQHPGAAVPKPFAGFSREWRTFPFPDSGDKSAVHPAYLRLVEQLAAFNDNALCFRIGGNSAEGMGTPPDDDRLKQIGQIFKASRTPVIIDINLQKGNVEADKQWIESAKRILPAGAIMAFELGNEPDGWPGRYRPADHTFEQYLDEFHATASQLVPSLTPGLAGPAWAHLAPPQVIEQFVAKEKGLVNLLTIHDYRFDPKKNPEPQKLLMEGSTAGVAKRLVPTIKAAHDLGLKLRLGETGSAWGGGVKGFSDTFAASLWTLDYMFELANAGLDGVNFHGGGMSNYTTIAENVDHGKTLGISARPSYYAMLLFAEAVAKNAHLVPVQIAPAPDQGHLKVWATVDQMGVLRIVAINKNIDRPADVTLAIGTNGTAHIKRLEAPSIDSTARVTYAGQTYDQSADGNPLGERREDTLKFDGRLQLVLAPASVVLLSVDR